MANDPLPSELPWKHLHRRTARAARPSFYYLSKGARHVLANQHFGLLLLLFIKRIFWKKNIRNRGKSEKREGYLLKRAMIARAELVVPEETNPSSGCTQTHPTKVSMYQFLLLITCSSCHEKYTKETKRTIFFLSSIFSFNNDHNILDLITHPIHRKFTWPK